MIYTDQDHNKSYLPLRLSLSLSLLDLKYIKFNIHPVLYTYKWIQREREKKPKGYI